MFACVFPYVKGNDEDICTNQSLQHAWCIHQQIIWNWVICKSCKTIPYIKLGSFIWRRNEEVWPHNLYKTNLHIYILRHTFVWSKWTRRHDNRRGIVFFDSRRIEESYFFSGKRRSGVILRIFSNCTNPLNKNCNSVLKIRGPKFVCKLTQICQFLSKSTPYFPIFYIYQSFRPSLQACSQH